MNFKELLNEMEEDSKFPIDKRASTNPQLAFTLIAKNNIDSYVQGKKTHHKEFVKKLGKWALNKWIENKWHGSKREKKYCKENHSCKNLVEHNIGEWGDGTHWKIAVACLGQKEVNERLAVVK